MRLTKLSLVGRVQPLGQTEPVALPLVVDALVVPPQTKKDHFSLLCNLVAEPTRLELATSAVTGQRSNQLSYDSTSIIITHITQFCKGDVEISMNYFDSSLSSFIYTASSITPTIAAMIITAPTTCTMKPAPA